MFAILFIPSMLKKVLVRLGVNGWWSSVSQQQELKRKTNNPSYSPLPSLVSYVKDDSDSHQGPRRKNLRVLLEKCVRSAIALKRQARIDLASNAIPILSNRCVWNSRSRTLLKILIGVWALVTLLCSSYSSFRNPSVRYLTLMLVLLRWEVVLDKLPYPAQSRPERSRPERRKF